MKNIRKMLCRLGLTAVVAVNLLAPVMAYPRSSGGSVQAVSEESGNRQTFYAVAVGTTTPAQIYAKTSNRVDRVLRVCNTLAFDLYLGTFSVVTTTHSASYVPHNNCIDHVSPTSDLWAIYESAAGAGANVVGFKQYDSRD